MSLQSLAKRTKIGCGGRKEGLDETRRPLSLADFPPALFPSGCGMEGNWVTAMASRFPKAEIIGVDLVPVSLR